MHGYLVTSSLIRETTENESPKERYRFGPEKETYDIVSAHVYFWLIDTSDMLVSAIFVLYISS